MNACPKKGRILLRFTLAEPQLTHLCESQLSRAVREQSLLHLHWWVFTCSVLTRAVREQSLLHLHWWVFTCSVLTCSHTVLARPHLILPLRSKNLRLKLVACRMQYIQVCLLQVSFECLPCARLQYASFFWLRSQTKEGIEVKEGTNTAPLASAGAAQQTETSFVWVLEWPTQPELLWSIHVKGRPMIVSRCYWLTCTRTNYLGKISGWFYFFCHQKVHFPTRMLSGGCCNQMFLHMCLTWKRISRMWGPLLSWPRQTTQRTVSNMKFEMIFHWQGHLNYIWCNHCSYLASATHFWCHLQHIFESSILSLSAAALGAVKVSTVAEVCLAADNACKNKKLWHDCIHAKQQKMSGS